MVELSGGRIASRLNCLLGVSLRRYDNDPSFCKFDEVAANGACQVAHLACRPWVLASEPLPPHSAMGECGERPHCASFAVHKYCSVMCLPTKACDTSAYVSSHSELGPLVRLSIWCTSVVQPLCPVLELVLFGPSIRNGSTECSFSNRHN